MVTHADEQAQTKISGDIFVVKVIEKDTNIRVSSLLSSIDGYQNTNIHMLLQFIRRGRPDRLRQSTRQFLNGGLYLQLSLSPNLCRALESGSSATDNHGH